jgi:hypothetical protein
MFPFAGKFSDAEKVPWESVFGPFPPLPIRVLSAVNLPESRPAPEALSAAR